MPGIKAKRKQFVRKTLMRAKEQSERTAEQRQEMDEQIKSVLTDAQYQKWTEMCSAMRTRHGHRRGYGPGQGKRSRPICDSVCPCAEAVSD